MAALTKNELVALNSKLATECAALRTQVSVLTQQLAARGTDPYESFSFRYPLTDSRGRAYRMDGRVKCFQPEQH